MKQPQHFAVDCLQRWKSYVETYSPRFPLPAAANVSPRRSRLQPHTTPALPPLAAVRRASEFRMKCGASRNTPHDDRSSKEGHTTSAFAQQIHTFNHRCGKQVPIWCRDNRNGLLGIHDFNTLDLPVSRETSTTPPCRHDISGKGLCHGASRVGNQAIRDTPFHLKFGISDKDSTFVIDVPNLPAEASYRSVGEEKPVPRETKMERLGPTATYPGIPRKKPILRLRQRAMRAPRTAPRHRLPHHSVAPHGDLPYSPTTCHSLIHTISHRCAKQFALHRLKLTQNGNRWICALQTGLRPPHARHRAFRTHLYLPQRRFM